MAGPIFPGGIDPSRANPNLRPGNDWSGGLRPGGSAPDGDRRHPRTDLAVEAHAAAQDALGQQIPGVMTQEEQRGSVHISRVHIVSRQGEEALGKVAGRYVTLDAPTLRQRNREVQNEVAEVLTDELARLMGLGPDDLVLVVGLGNWNATPDALGPRVVASLLVTRHLRKYLPQELVGHLRGVAAIAPGVLGLTGMETSDIIKGIVSQVHPQAVICIDALAARNLERVGTSIQIADTGINPGSGVGNHRAGLTEETLGIPVYALGVPTVVHATTIANDALDVVIEHLRQEQPLLPPPPGPGAPQAPGMSAPPGGANGHAPASQGLEHMEDFDRQQMVRDVLAQPSTGDLIVTPKDIDVMITDLSRILAGALNASLHPGVTKDEMDQYLN